MKQEDDIALKQESDTDAGCPICLEPFESQTEVALLLCCSTSTSLKALDSGCAQNIFKQQNSTCPCCRKPQPKRIILDGESFQKLSVLNEKELKNILDLRNSQTPEIFLNSVKLILVASSDKEKDLYFFLWKNNLTSQEYFDNSSLPVKIAKSINDKISPDVMLVAIEKFLATGMDVNATDGYGWTVLDYICRYWSEVKVPSEIMLSVIDKLLEAKINVKNVAQNGWTALHRICFHWPKANVSHKIIMAVIEKLLIAGVDSKAVTNDGQTALQILEKSSDDNSAKLSKSVHLLITAQAAPPEQKDFYAFLLSNNLTSQEYFDDSPLPVKMAKLLTDKVSPDVMLTAIEKLLSMGVDVNAPDEDGWTALHFICHFWAEANIPAEMISTVINKLLKAGIDVNAPDKDGCTALHYIFCYWPEKHVPSETILSVTNKLLEASINVNAINNQGATVLHLICAYWPKANVPPKIIITAIDRLLEAKIDVNAGKNDWTILHLICDCWPQTKVSREIILKVIEKLLVAGINVNVVNKEGKTALQILESFPNDETKKLAKNVRLLIVAYTAPPEKKDFYLFLVNNNLTSSEYFDDSSLPVKVRKLLDDKVSPEVMPAIIEKFLAQEMDVDAADKNGWNALHIICRDWPEAKIPSEIMLTVIDKLLAVKVNVNAVISDGANDGWTALHYICRGWPEAKVPAEMMLTVIDKFLKVNVNVNAAINGWTVLHSVCSCWPKAKVPSEIIVTAIDKLLKANIDVNAPTNEGATALHLICCFWPEAKVSTETMLTVINKLLEAKINVNAPDKNGLTVLDLICHNWPEAKVPSEIILTVIDKLLEARIDVNAATNNKGTTALYFICRYWPEEKISPETIVTVINKLLEAKINVNTTTDIGWTALHLICRYWPKAKIPHEIILTVIDKLLIAGIKVDAINKEGKTALQILESFPDDETKKLAKSVRLLIAAHAAPPEKKDYYLFLLNNNLTSQEYFDDSSLPVKLRKLLDDKASPEVTLAAIEKFIAMGIKVNAVDKNGWTALHVVCRLWTKAGISSEIMLKAINKLLEEKINPNLVIPSLGFTALHFICRDWPSQAISSEIILAVIKKLLDAKADVNVVDKTGFTALHLICCYWLGHASTEIMLSIIDKILAVTTDINAADEHGRTALHIICRHWLRAPYEITLTVEKLLKAGINVNAVNKEGNTALQILESFPNDDETKKLAKSVRLLIAAHAAPPEKKDFYLFLLNNNLTSQEYFDDSPLPGKMAKLLADKVPSDVMLVVIEKFLAVGMDVNADKDGMNTLHYVCRYWPENKFPSETTLAIIDKLLEAKINVNATTNRGSTALGLICSWWSEAKVPSEIILNVINKLLEAKTDVNPANKDGWTALHFICRYWLEEEVPLETILTVINKFLETKIDVNAVTNKGWNMLHFICRHWPEARVPHKTIMAVIEKLLLAGIKVDVPYKEGKTALQILETSADNNSQKLAKSIRLLIAAQTAPPEKKDFYAFLLSNNLTSQEYFDDSSLPVKMAKLLTDAVPPDVMLAAIEKFLALGMDVNATDKDNRNALHHICRTWPKAKIPSEIMLLAIDKLLAAKINVNAINIDGSALHYICLNRPTKDYSEWIIPIVDKLLRAGINVNVGDLYGLTALHCIGMFWGYENDVPSKLTFTVIDKLLEAHIDVNIADQGETTALYWIQKHWQFTPFERITIVNKLLHANANVNTGGAHKTKSLPSDNLIDLLNKNIKQPQLNTQVASKYLLQQMNANEIESAAKIWDWVRDKSSRLQEFKAIVTASEDYHYPLAFAQLHRYVTKSFFKDNQEISAGYRRVIELLLTPTINFVLSEEQLQILEEIAAFDKQLLSPQLVTGLKLFFAPHITERDVHKAYECFLQAAQAGWLLGYILAAQQCERGLDAAKNLDQAIEHQGEVIFSPHVAANNLNKKYFVFALEKLHELANKKKETFALKILGDYYQKLGKTTKAIDFFLQAKNKAETIKQQQLVNEKIESLIFETTLALGKLSHESGAVVKACQEYGYGPAYITMAQLYIKDESESQIFEAVECYCQATTTSYQPQTKEALEGLITKASSIQIDQKSCFKIITTLADFIDANKGKVIALQIPLLLKLIQALKMEKLFLESVSKSETQDKLELFTHKFSSKTLFSTDYARAFILLIENKNIHETCQIIVKDEKQEKIIEFYQRILDNQNELPPHLSNIEICQRAKQILQNLNENLSALPALT